MSNPTRIDETDIKILKALIRSARESLIPIAEECGISTTAVAKRIEHLKKTGIITGASFIVGAEVVGYSTVAVVGVTAEYAQKLEIAQSIREQQKQNITGCWESIGHYDIIFGIATESLKDLDKAVQYVKGLRGVKKVEVHVWLGKPHFTLANLVLQPMGVQCE